MDLICNDQNENGGNSGGLSYRKLLIRTCKHIQYQIVLYVWINKPVKNLKGKQNTSTSIGWLYICLT